MRTRDIFSFVCLISPLAAMLVVIAPKPLAWTASDIRVRMVPRPDHQSTRVEFRCDSVPYAYVADCFDGLRLAALNEVLQSPPELTRPSDADIRAGYLIARDNCRVCHVINPEQTTRPILIHPGPNFTDIAGRPDLTLESLSDLISRQDWDLQSRPVQMPKRNLSKRSIMQVSAYILSLRKQL